MVTLRVLAALAMRACSAVERRTERRLEVLPWPCGVAGCIYGSWRAVLWLTKSV
jgi:hypothetical protein